MQCIWEQGFEEQRGTRGRVTFMVGDTWTSKGCCGCSPPHVSQRGSRHVSRVRTTFVLRSRTGSRQKGGSPHAQSLSVVAATNRRSSRCDRCDLRPLHPATLKSKSSGEFQEVDPRIVDTCTHTMGELYKSSKYLNFNMLEYLLKAFYLNMGIEYVWLDIKI